MHMHIFGLQCIVQSDLSVIYQGLTNELSHQPSRDGGGCGH